MSIFDIKGDVRKSGLIKDFEEIIFAVPAEHKSIGSGFIVLTNCRFLFLKRPGMISKGFVQQFSYGLLNITGVSTSGLLSRDLIVQTIDGVEVFIDIVRPNLLADKILQAVRDTEQENREYETENKMGDERRYCPKCGRNIPFDANICPYCGNKF